MSYNLTGAAYGGNVNLSFNTLTLPAAASTVTTTGAKTYAVKGQLYTKAALAAAALPVLDIATGKAFVPVNIGETVIVGLFLDAAGNVVAAQGPKVASLDFSGGLAAAQFPQLSDTYAPFGYVLVKSDPAAAVAPWVFGTNNTSGVTGVTTAAREVMDYPAQPIVA